MPKEKIVGHHETWRDCNSFTFMFLTLFANYGFWFAFFIVWMMFGVARLVFCATFGCNAFGECECAI